MCYVLYCRNRLKNVARMILTDMKTRCYACGGSSATNLAGVEVSISTNPAYLPAHDEVNISCSVILTCVCCYVCVIEAMG